MSRCLLLALAIACGDNTAPAVDTQLDAPSDAYVKLWSDAVEQYSTAYCLHLFRCWPEHEDELGGLATCTLNASAYYCRIGGALCTRPYPSELEPHMDTCVADMQTRECKWGAPPQSCYRAFGL